MRLVLTDKRIKRRMTRQFDVLTDLVQYHQKTVKEGKRVAHGQPRKAAHWNLVS